VRWSAAEHLVEESAQTPPVSSFAVPDALDDLWSQVLGSSTVGVCLGVDLVGRYSLFRESEIGDLDVSLVVKEDVLRLEISIDNAVHVEASESFNELGCIEAGSALRELLVLA